MPVKSKGGNHVALHKGGSVLDKKQNKQPKDKFGMTTPAGLKSRMSVWRVLPCRLELTRLILYDMYFMQYQAVLCQYT